MTTLGSAGERVRSLRRIMRRRGIGALLVTGRENIRYLTGFTGSAGWVIVAGARPLLITDFRYRTQAAVESPQVRLVIQQRDLVSAVGDTGRRLGVQTLWFDEASLTFDRVRQLRKQGFRLQGVQDPVADLRTRKDPGEIRKIRTAIRRAEESFLALRSSLKAGMTEREVALRLEWFMRQKGARKAAFDIIVASGGNGAMPHASASSRRLRAGDLVTIDFGAEADGYFCDITRTLCLGRPTSRQRELHELVLRAQQAAVSAIRVGAPCADVDKAARDVITAAGWGEQFGHATGHGIGLLVHEAPSLSRLAKGRLEAGMVVTVEPGVYRPGWGGIRIEDMVLVTEEGPRIMTALPRDLA
jgi:Xaa-Pro aminopeptidase